MGTATSVGSSEREREKERERETERKKEREREIAVIKTCSEEQLRAMRGRPSSKYTLLASAGMSSAGATPN